MSGEVKEIWIAPEPHVPMEERSEVEAVVGEGLVGDRYFRSANKFSVEKYDRAPREMTLIQSEALINAGEEFGVSLTPDMLRRNVVTSGIDLNGLVGKRFQIGEVELEGLELCEPCQHISDMNGLPLIHWMLHRAGLRARITRSGKIKKKDPVRVL